MTLTKDQIVSADDVVKEKVDVPEWGGDVFVKSMNGSERDAYEASLIQDRKLNLQDITAKLCARCIVDEAGNRIFSDDEITTLSGKSAKALSRVFSKAQELNALRPKDIAELEKNFGSGPNVDSISD